MVCPFGQAFHHEKTIGCNISFSGNKDIPLTVVRQGYN